MKDTFQDILDRYAAAGLAAYPAATLSHLCFKFPDEAAFRRGIEQAAKIGIVIFKEFRGKQIVWCRLHKPVGEGALRLEFLELVEPAAGENQSGITSIGYAVPGLSEAVKIPSADGRLVFRYQAAHAAALAEG